MAQADTQDAVAATLRRATRAAAIAADLPGLPGYVLDGEPFWGQDRIDALRDAPASAGVRPTGPIRRVSPDCRSIRPTCRMPLPRR